MWLFSKYGAYSVVSHHTDRFTLLVRSRTKPDLENIVTLCLVAGIAPPEIHESCQSDYRFRMFMGREAWLAVSILLMQQIDYPNFKAKIHGEPFRDTAYMKIWSAMRQFQEADQEYTQEVHLPDFVCERHHYYPEDYIRCPKCEEEEGILAGMTTVELSGEWLHDYVIEDARRYGSTADDGSYDDEAGDDE